MTIRLECENQGYTGLNTFIDDSKLTNWGLYNDTLPIGTGSEKIGLTKDPLGSHRYVIEPATIEVKAGGIDLKAGGKTPSTLTIPNYSFQYLGIEVFIRENDRLFKGRIFPT